MNKSDIKKLVRENPSEETIATTALNRVDEEDKDYLDLLLTKKPKKARAVQLMLTGGHKTSEIASLLGVKRQTINRWLAEDEVKQYMKLYQKDEAMIIQAKIKAATTAAMEKMVDLMDSPIDGIALQAAKDILDRSGHKAKQEVKKEVVVRTFEQKMNELLGDEIIDVDYETLDEDNEIDIMSEEK